MGKEKVRAKIIITIPDSGKIQYDFKGDLNTNWIRVISAKMLREYRTDKQRRTHGKSDSDTE
jgi:hypothetical protein